MPVSAILKGLIMLRKVSIWLVSVLLVECIMLYAIRNTINSRAGGSTAITNYFVTLKKVVLSRDFQKKIILNAARSKPLNNKVMPAQADPSEKKSVFDDVIKQVFQGVLNNGVFDNSVTSGHIGTLEEQVMSNDSMKGLLQGTGDSQPPDEKTTTQKPGTPGEIVVSGGVRREPQLLLTPVWIRENKYFQITQEPVLVKVSKKTAGKETRATVEIKYPDGETQVFNDVYIGEKIFLKNRLRYLVLVDFESGNEYGKKTGVVIPTGSEIEIALYQKY